MQGGFHIADTETTNVVISYYEHKDISYGCDWSYMGETQVKSYGGNGKQIIATCSFYDHKLCVANVNFDL